MRTTMNGKPVIEQATRTIINFKSGFEKKLLCDGPTFTTGTACAYSCSFCYVPSAMLKLTKMTEDQHMNIVIRRSNPIETLKSQLTVRGKPKFMNDGPKVIYASPLVDVAANMDLVRETIEACLMILSLTSWHIRLLSKSNLLSKVAEGLSTDDARRRVIYGLSTGTFDDKIAAAFEQGTPKVSKRIECLHHLQDDGFRTFGMICPSLPQELSNMEAYYTFAETAAREIRKDKCEHVWAEPLNVRGQSMVRTVDALGLAGFHQLAACVEKVSKDKCNWEDYARRTFTAHRIVGGYKPGQLRFLQYVNNDNRAYWQSNAAEGAVLL
jgi:DNA repair photolyase